MKNENYSLFKGTEKLGDYTSIKELVPKLKEIGFDLTDALDLVNVRKVVFEDETYYLK